MCRGYFDNNATTRPLPEVLAAMTPFLRERFGNPSAIHARGVAARQALEAARGSVARLLGCQADEVVFTSGGTEGDCMAILGVCRPGDHVITSPIEHHAVDNTCRYLERLGCQVTRVAVDGQGRVDPEAVRRALRPGTRLISVMMANNETGVLQPVEEIGRVAAEAGALFHCDAVQAAGKVPISVGSIGCQLLTITGHKMHGPQGAGALYLRRGTPFAPLLHGGGQERGRRPGTENLAGIVGLGKAAELACAGLEDGTVTHLETWRDRFEAHLLDRIPAVEINSGQAKRVPNTSSVFFDYLLGSAVVVALDEIGFAASTGSACSAGSPDPSHVLTAMGHSGRRGRGSVRFSLGKLTTAEEVQALSTALPDLVQGLRDRSPLYRKAES